MKKVYLLAVIAAALFGGLMYLFLTNQTSSANAVDTKPVVVAAVDIPAYETITQDMVKVVDKPSEGVHALAATSVDDVVGKKCASQIVQGEMILTSMLGTDDQVGSALSYQLDDGCYAMTVSLDTAAGVGGYLVEGDKIDLLGALTDDEENVVGSVTIASNVLVLKVGDTSEQTEGSTAYTSVTLSLSLQQCETLYAYQAQHPSGSVTSLYAILCQRGGAQ